MVLGVVSIVFGIFLISIGLDALGAGESFAGTLAAMSGAVFFLGGWKAIAA